MNIVYRLVCPLEFMSFWPQFTLHTLHTSYMKMPVYIFNIIGFGGCTQRMYSHIAELSWERNGHRRKISLSAGKIGGTRKNSDRLVRENEMSVPKCWRETSAHLQSTKRRRYSILWISLFLSILSFFSLLAFSGPSYQRDKLWICSEHLKLKFKS